MIDRAYNALLNEKFLQEFLPLPNFDELAQENQQYHDATTSNLWCVDNWGTKWDVGDGDCTEREDANTIHASFDSAWSPPCQAYEYLVKLGFEITAYYDEPGVGFCGKWTGNADGFEDDYREYDGETSETVRKVIGEELDDYFGVSEHLAQMEDYEDENDSE